MPAKSAAPKSAPATKKAKSAALPSPMHPPYLQMIKEAIGALKERTGSSQPAIAKFIEDKYKAGLPVNFKKQLSVQLKKFAQSEKLVRVKNSFKIAPAIKKSAEATATATSTAAKPKKMAVKKPATSSAVKPKKMAVKKPAASSAVKPKKTAAKKPATSASAAASSAAKPSSAVKRKASAMSGGSAAGAKKKAATKRLSQVKTPSGMKKKPMPKMVVKSLKAMSAKPVVAKRARVA